MENYLGSPECSCGKTHTVAIDDVVVGKGVIARLPEFVAKCGAKKPFILADCNTFKAAGEAVADILKTKQIVCAPGTVIAPEVLDNSKMISWDMGHSISQLEGKGFTAGQYDTYLIAYTEDGTFDICFVDVEEGAETEYFEEYPSVKVR